ncbi:hypothetical protein EV191_11684 [Tamaricihabitans halophyticus]|uniref:Intracellular septation protein A n=1 Tax=Tamaricihabitans halophyticus TaxID=1262583 RepID=A0A4R2QEG8_9PSEU|nr:VC0807 family protein [Tamaricihabitans halophyticus]TCP45441.1 hypothetical protein EV191_11684 [Tamaricihabitans halophyticus]
MNNPQSTDMADADRESGTTADVPAGKSTGGNRELITVAILDIVAPVALYYGLRALGLTPWLALLLGAIPPAARALFSLVRHRRIEWFAVLVLVLIAASAATSFLSGSPRFLLAKDGAITAALAAVVLATVRASKPAMYSVGRMMVSGSGHDPSDWDERLRTSARFRRIWQVLTVLWGIGLLLDSVLRVVFAYTLPVDVVPGLSTVQWLVLLVALQIVSQVYLRRPANRPLVFD